MSITRTTLVKSAFSSKFSNIEFSFWEQKNTNKEQSGSRSDSPKQSAVIHRGRPTWLWVTWWPNTMCSLAKWFPLNSCVDHSLSSCGRLAAPFVNETVPVKHEAMINLILLQLPLRCSFISGWGKCGAVGWWNVQTFDINSLIGIQPHLFETLNDLCVHVVRTRELKIGPMEFSKDALGLILMNTSWKIGIAYVSGLFGWIMTL